MVSGWVSEFHLRSSPLQRFGFASSSSPESSEKEHGSNAESNEEPPKTNGDTKLYGQTEDSAAGQDDVADQTKESGSISDS